MYVYPFDYYLTSIDLLNKILKYFSRALLNLIVLAKHREAAITVTKAVVKLMTTYKRGYNFSDNHT